MAGIINGFKWFISTIKLLVGFVMDFFKTIALVFTYLIKIVELAFNAIFTFPPMIKAFAIVTIAISLCYFLIGRNTGKSD